MLGLIAACIAILLGALGPRFRWTGAGWLALAAIVVGVIATVMADREAMAHGAQFVITPVSVALGLALQAIFMLTFYGMAALARWSWRGLTRRPDELPPAGE